MRILILLLIASLLGCETFRNLLGTSENVKEMTEDGREITKVVREFMVESLLPTLVIGLLYLRSLWTGRKWKKRALNGEKVVIPEEPDGASSS